MDATAFAGVAAVPRSRLYLLFTRSAREAAKLLVQTRGSRIVRVRRASQSLGSFSLPYGM